MDHEYLVSYFNDITQKKTKDIPLSQIFNEIKDEVHTSKISAIRCETDKVKRNLLKRSLPAITTSCTMTESHIISDFVQHSGLIQIDVDDVPNLSEFQNKIKDDRFTYAGFISPSGNGYKIIVKIKPDKDAHERSFLALQSYYLNSYNIEIDKKCGNVNRLMFLSADQNLYVNEEADEFLEEPLKANRPVVAAKSFLPISNTWDDVENVIRQIKMYQIDITSDYGTWLKIGFSFAEEFGESGRDFFHQVSRYNLKYDYTLCDKQFDNCLKSNNTVKSTIKSFFQIAKEHRIEIKSLELPQKHLEIEKKGNPLNMTASVFYRAKYGKDQEGNPIICDVIINYKPFIELLYSFGFRRFDIEKNFIFVRIEKMVIKEVTITQIQDFFISYVKGLNDILEFGIKREMLIEKIYRNPSNYFCENKLSLLRSEEEIKFNSDTKNESYVYYLNGYVRCRSDGYSLHSYETLDSHIWKNQILVRNFSKRKISEDMNDWGTFARFVYNLANKDIKRFISLCSIIGYNLHTYFDYKLKATIFTDSKISDRPDGRTGKTLICKGLSEIKTLTDISGKEFDPADKHKYNLVGLDTQIVCLNDLRRNFVFESLYNDITEYITVDKKNKEPFKIKAKIMITTNKTIQTEGDSSKDRCIEFEMSEHYSSSYSPSNEFGVWFFTGWDLNQWAEFDNFMANCIVLFLREGLIEVGPINLHRRKLIDNTCPEFVEFMKEMMESGHLKLDVEYNKKEIFEKFLDEYPDLRDHKFFGSQRAFVKFLQKYSFYMEDIEDELHERKSMSNRFFTFRSKR